MLVLVTEFFHLDVFFKVIVKVLGLFVLIFFFVRILAAVNICVHIY